MLAGCSWATLITCCWPRTHPAAIAAAPPDPKPDPAATRRAMHLYAAMFAAAAAAMFIMRPDPGLLASRAVGRTAATFAGVIAAGLLLRRGPAEIALAVVTIAAIAAMTAVRTSRWYVASAGSGLIVLLISGISGTREFDISFAERLLETALGAGLALTFGVAIPAGLRWLTRKHAATDPAPQAPVR